MGDKKLSVAIDRNSCTQKHFEVLNQAFGNHSCCIVHDKAIVPLDLTPVSHLRVVKSEAEVAGMERALKLESAALIAFYAKLENRLVEKREKIYEHEVPVILNELRS